MAYPMLESPIGGKYLYDGKIITEGSAEAAKLYEPTEEVTYYETVRIKEGVLLYVEAHLDRLEKSVKGIEDFPVDKKDIEKISYDFLRQQFPDFKEGNLRIVLTKNHLLIHICEANIPSEELFEKGIPTHILKWDRVDPNIKVFRGDYKKAVAEVFANTDAYEVSLCLSSSYPFSSRTRKADSTRSSRLLLTATSTFFPQVLPILQSSAYSAFLLTMPTRRNRSSRRQALPHVSTTSSLSSYPMQ